MEYRILGKTGLRVSRVGFGGIPIQRIDAAGTKALVERLLEAGVNYIDLAAAKRASVRLEARGKQSAASPAGGAAASEDLPAAVAGLRTGDQVRHDSYGVGTVVGLEGKGRSLTARVEFVIDGAPATKRLILRYAPVAKI